MKKEVIQVEGMTCGHCKSAVEGALTNMDGVSSAEVNLEANNVTVNFDENAVSVEKMKEEIEEQGYDIA